MATARQPAGIGADDAAALKKLAKQAGDAAQLLKLLANENRLLILCFLAARGEMTVGELVDVVKLSQSALSQHLAKLRADGLVVFRRTAPTNESIMLYVFAAMLVIPIALACGNFTERA